MRKIAGFALLGALALTPLACRQNKATGAGDDTNTMTPATEHLNSATRDDAMDDSSRTDQLNEGVERRTGYENEATRPEGDDAMAPTTEDPALPDSLGGNTSRHEDLDRDIDTGATDESMPPAPTTPETRTSP